MTQECGAGAEAAGVETTEEAVLGTVDGHSGVFVGVVVLFFLSISSFVAVAVVFAIIAILCACSPLFRQSLHPCPAPIFFSGFLF